MLEIQLDNMTISTADEHSEEFETVFNEKRYFCTMDKTLKELIGKKLRMVELTKWEKVSSIC